MEYFKQGMRILTAQPKFEDNYINGNMSDYVVIDIIVYERGM